MGLQTGIVFYTFGPKSFGKKTSDKKLSSTFSGISDKKPSDKYDIKKQARYQKDVKNNGDSGHLNVIFVRLKNGKPAVNKIKRCCHT